MSYMYNVHTYTHAHTHTHISIALRQWPLHKELLCMYMQYTEHRPHTRIEHSFSEASSLQRAFTVTTLLLTLEWLHQLHSDSSVWEVVIAIATKGLTLQQACVQQTFVCVCVCVCSYTLYKMLGDTNDWNMSLCSNNKFANILIQQ